MIRIIEELENNRVMIESDSGKMLDIGGGAVQKMIVHKSEMEYVEEVDPEEPENEPEEINV